MTYGVVDLFCGVGGLTSVLWNGFHKAHYSRTHFLALVIVQIVTAVVTDQLSSGFFAASLPYRASPSVRFSQSYS